MGVSEIVPRWEWRTFGARFGAADAVLAGLTPTGVEESDELYFLSENGDNVKVRAEIIDIKVLREVDRHGLEQWEPVLKASFPLDAAAVAAVFEALHQPVPDLSRDAYSLTRAPRRARRAQRNDPCRVRPQATGPLHDRRLHGRAVRHRGRWSAHPHARPRGRGSGRSDGPASSPSDWGSASTPACQEA